MKLIIQIPCLNEEETLPSTIESLPKKIEGIDEIEVLIVDDGSSDNTSQVAKKCGAHHIVRFTKHKGLAEAFMAGLDEALRKGAHIIVNTDADNQYCAEDIEKLVAPILEGKADIVIGDREIMKIEHFSFLKKILQRLGSWTVRQLSGTSVPDTTSGFRAFSRESALKLNVISRFTYTLETIIQAGKKNLAVHHVPVRTNPATRDSRLFRSIWSYLKKSMSTILRIYTVYEPLKIFVYAGSTVFFVGSLLLIRFLYFYIFNIRPYGHIQSLIISAVLLIIGFIIVTIGVIADLIAANRKLVEEALYRVKKIELKENDKNKGPETDK